MAVHASELQRLCDSFDEQQEAMAERHAEEKRALQQEVDELIVQVMCESTKSGLSVGKEVSARSVGRGCAAAWEWREVTRLQGEIRVRGEWIRWVGVARARGLREPGGSSTGRMTGVGARGQLPPRVLGSLHAAWLR